MGKTIEEFNAFDSLNPKVYELFKKFSFAAIAKGRKNFGAQMIIERIRWYSEIETDGDIYKINNDFVPYYTRKFINEHPEHKSFFRIRQSVADEKRNIWAVELPGRVEVFVDEVENIKAFNFSARPATTAEAKRLLASGKEKIVIINSYK